MISIRLVTTESEPSKSVVTSGAKKKEGSERRLRGAARRARWGAPGLPRAVSAGCVAGADTSLDRDGTEGEEERVAETSLALSRAGAGVHVALNLAGKDLHRPERWSSEFSMDSGWDPVQNPRVLADVDGDGRQDVVAFADDGVRVARSWGRGFRRARAGPRTSAGGTRVAGTRRGIRASSGT